MTDGMQHAFSARALLSAGCVLAAAALSAVELEGPEVVKIGWSTGSLVAADIDGDGRTDLAIINNDRAGIEVLIQRKPGSAVESDTALGSRSLATGAGGLSVRTAGSSHRKPHVRPRRR